MSVATAVALEDYVGLSNADGSEISGDAHLRQSLRDLLMTPIGTRVMRRTYGSLIPALMDAPMTAGLLADIVASVAEAIIAWEPRVTLRQVLVNSVTSAGQFSLDLVVVLAGTTITLEGVI